MAKVAQFLWELLFTVSHSASVLCVFIVTEAFVPVEMGNEPF